MVGAFASLAEERVLALGAVDGGRLEQLPAVEDRLRVDARRALAGRADLEEHVAARGSSGVADAAEDGARRRSSAPGFRRFHVTWLGAEVQQLLGVRRRGPAGTGAPTCRLPPALKACGPLRVGEQPLLAAGARSTAPARGSTAGVVAAALGGGAVAVGVGLRLGAALRDGVGGLELGEAPVGVGVAEGVADLDVAAEARGRCRGRRPCRRASRRRRCPACGEDEVAGRCGCVAGDVVGVARLAVEREAALGQAGERADEVGGQAADDAGRA